MWLTGCLKRDWLKKARVKLTLKDLLWLPVYVAVFLKIKGDSYGTIGTYFWVFLLTMIVVGCLRQVYFLWLDPEKLLKGMTSFRVTVSFTRLLAACLIFFGANWPPKGHLFEQYEHHWVNNPVRDIERFVGFVTSVATGNIASNCLKPVGIILAFFPFWRAPFVTSQVSYSKLFRRAVFLGLAIILGLSLIDQLFAHSLVWTAIYGINRTWSAKNWPAESLQASATMGDIEAASLLTMTMVVGAVIAIGFFLSTRPAVRLAAGLSSIVLLICATFSAWRIRMQLFPCVSPTFQTSTEPLMTSALLLMALIAIASGWIVVQLLIQNFGRRPQTLSSEIIQGISFPPAFAFLYSGVCLIIVMYSLFEFLQFLPRVFLAMTPIHSFAWPFDSEPMIRFASALARLFSSEKCPMRFHAEGVLPHFYIALALLGFAGSHWKARRPNAPRYVFHAYGFWSTIFLWLLICGIVVVGAEAFGQWLRSQLMGGYSFTNAVFVEHLPINWSFGWLPYWLHIFLLIGLISLAIELRRRRQRTRGN